MMQSLDCYHIHKGSYGSLKCVIGCTDKTCYRRLGYNYELGKFIYDSVQQLSQLTNKMINIRRYNTCDT